MGCLKRFLLCGCSGTLALVFLAGGILGLLAQSLRQNSLQARSAPVKTLFEALNSDGPAWVRVRLEPASASEVLRCGETPAVWVSFQGRELVTQEIRRGGAWRMRSVWKKPAVEARTVPVLLKTDAAQFLLTDWLGVEPWPDLFQRRRITDYLNAENGPRLTEESEWDPASAASAVHASTAAAISISTAGVVLKREGEEVFVSPGIEVWALGRFEKGMPQAYVNDRFYLTGLGPENFAAALEPRFAWLGTFHWLFDLLSVCCLVIFFRFLLKSS